MAAQDSYSWRQDRLTDPITGGEAVTPSDSADLTYITRQLYVGSGGTLRVTFMDGMTLDYPSIPDGSFLDWRVSRVHATGTTCGSIRAHW